MFNIQLSSSSTLGAEGQPPPSSSAAAPPDSRRKIRRPPNAFMLYARENRKAIAEKNPQVNNKNISTMLGNLWRGLDSFTKESYFEKARIMDKMHKQKYPGYVYNPKEARLKKQNREMSKRMKKQSENGSSRPGVLINSVTSAGRQNIRNGGASQLNETAVNVVKMEFYVDNSDRNNDETFSPEYTPNNPMTFTDSQPEISKDHRSTPRTHAFQTHKTSTPQQIHMPPRNGNRPNSSWYASPDEPGALFAAPPGGQMYHTSTPRPVPYGLRCYAGSQEGPRYFPGPHESSNWNQLAKGYEGRYYMQPYDFPQPSMASQPHFFRPPPGPPSATQTSESSSSSECNAEASHSPSAACANKPYAMYPFLRVPMPYHAYYPPNLNLEAYYGGSVYGMDPEDMASGSYDASFAWPIAHGGYFRGMPMGRPYRQHESPSTCQSSQHNESEQRQSPCVIVDDNVNVEVKTNDSNSTVPPVMSIAATAFESVVSNSLTVLNYSADASSGGERAPVGQRKSPPKKSSLWRTNV